MSFNNIKVFFIDIILFLNHNSQCNIGFLEKLSFFRLSSIFDPLCLTGTQWIVDKVMKEHSLHSVLICDIHTVRFPLDCSRAAVCPFTLFRVRCCLLSLQLLPQGTFRTEELTQPHCRDVQRLGKDLAFINLFMSNLSCYIQKYSSSSSLWRKYF